MQRGCLCSPLLAVNPHSLSKQTVERLVNKIRIFFSLREGGGKKSLFSGRRKRFSLSSLCQRLCPAVLQGLAAGREEGVGRQHCWGGLKLGKLAALLKLSVLKAQVGN